jgi:hypothetical protein
MRVLRSLLGFNRPKFDRLRGRGEVTARVHGRTKTTAEPREHDQLPSPPIREGLDATEEEEVMGFRTLINERKRR